MKLIPWMVLFSLVLASCSGSKSANNVAQENPQIELSDADEFIENPMEEQEPSLDDATSSEVAESAALPTDTPEVAEVPTEEPMVHDLMEDAAPVVETETAMNAPTPVSMGNVESNYTVEKNETLMMISFKLYGDYSKWRDIANMNQDKLKNGQTVQAGMVLRYMAPAENFIWSPEGNPYLIRTGDTLGGISKQSYGTVKKWKSIWDNNRPLIKDPNKIFAGFTIYTLDGRQVASESL